MDPKKSIQPYQDSDIAYRDDRTRLHKTTYLICINFSSRSGILPIIQKYYLSGLFFIQLSKQFFYSSFGLGILSL